MRENDQETAHHHEPHSFKKKCKKKRSPPEDDPDIRRKHHRTYDDPDARRKESTTATNCDRESKRERDYEGIESRRKEGRERQHQDSGRRKRTNRYYRETRRTGQNARPKIKQEPLSDDASRSPSPSTGHREDRKPSNLDTIMNIKDEKHDWGKSEDQDKKKPPKENKAKPDFGLSGKLAEETNIVNGIVIKYSEPEEARKPRVRWRLYPFKGDEGLPVLHLHRQSAYLIGRDRKIADLPVDHPSCSKQHAVFQYRLVPFTRHDGSQGKRVRPYIIDLESANGTFINNNKIEPKKYVELLERDVIKFAFSSREYVLLHEHSKDAHLDDDVQ